MNRLTREDNYESGKTTLFTYDVGGNITSKKEYAVTSANTPTGSYVGSDYTYATDGWRDQMTSFRGEACIYDKIGNPTTYRNHNLSWTKVRRLASFDTHTFEYNASGIRTKKDEITYTLDGNKILKQTKYGVDLTFYYGVNGIVGFNYWGTDYYYVKNLQGDVYEIYRDDYGTLTCVAKYVYDAWGNILAITDGNGTDVSTVADHIANVNPIRYRSYYYDQETNLYYLETRYYDPETGRFLNADSIDYLDPETIQGANLYAYCGNNPVMYADETGHFPWHIIVGAVFGVAVQYISDVCYNIASGKTGVDVLKPTSSIADYVSAGVSGALAATGIGTVGAKMTNTAIDGMTYIINQSLEGEEINMLDLTMTAIGSMVFSSKGIDGSNLSGVYRSSKRTLKNAVSPKKIGMYTAKITTVKKTVTKKMVGTLRDEAIVGVFNGLNERYNFICNSYRRIIE